jgi:hypothetical protein
MVSFSRQEGLLLHESATLTLAPFEVSLKPTRRSRSPSTNTSLSAQPEVTALHPPPFPALDESHPDITAACVCGGEHALAGLLAGWVRPRRRIYEQW